MHILDMDLRSETKKRNNTINRLVQGSRGHYQKRTYRPPPPVHVIKRQQNYDRIMKQQNYLSFMNALNKNEQNHFSNVNPLIGKQQNDEVRNLLETSFLKTHGKPLELKNTRTSKALVLPRNIVLTNFERQILENSKSYLE